MGWHSLFHAEMTLDVGKGVTKRYAPCFTLPASQVALVVTPMLCMKYCSVSNYFTRVYAIYIYLFFLFILFTLFFYSYFLFCFFSLSFSFSFSFLFFSFFFLCKSGVIRKLFGLHCFPFNIVGFAYLHCTCLSHEYRFRTFRLRKIALWVQN